MWGESASVSSSGWVAGTRSASVRGSAASISLG